MGLHFSGKDLELEDDTWCELCGEDVGLGSHYHCANCGEISGQFGHWDETIKGFSCQE